MDLIVRNQQVQLFRLGCDPHGIDGADGKNTQGARREFQALHGLEPTGLSDPEFARALADAAGVLPKFIQAKNFTPRSRPWTEPLDVVAIHTAEAPEIHSEALNIAGWFSMQPVDGALLNGKKFGGSSAHYVIDDTQIVQCVLECDRAWHVGIGNDYSIGIEHAGYASQSPPQWGDEYSTKVLALSAELVARLCLRWSIPMAKLGPDDLRARRRGIAGHVDFTNGLAGGKGHQDPGPSFPWDTYIAAVKAAAGQHGANDLSKCGAALEAAAARLRGG